ncbi:LuxR C-terminal-related transcriptional regulator [Algibacter sp. 2305UL17-15]|uniref:response regulator transcription factor n=1 Tax=Algibacter sp. 2305UL17-15 TaxID=3231268 RepID=UPI003459AE8E
MIAHKEIIKTINTLKKNGAVLSKNGILKVLNATKSITTHKETVDSLILFLTTLDPKYEHKIEKLTKRELQVLKFVGQGNSSFKIAKELNLSLSTIETHRKNIRKKLKLVGKGKLIEFAILHNLRRPD